MELNPRGRYDFVPQVSLSLSLARVRLYYIAAVALFSFSIEKREMFIPKRSNVSSRFDAFIWEFIMMSQLRHSFAYSNNERDGAKK